jgi:DNA gyrase subunit A
LRTDDLEHGEPMVLTATGATVMFTPFSEYPA